ncbi:unnamed protein product [Spirodela intermedia]|uniref:SHSP domain-containing protein n=2 Tax=Spirodela intermedia TaxID=51605 RepID=A0A7I8LNT8_SPIIN|nr:unnamed protein product [Spirodela intermedia]CAA6673785.1 unnamed protein product [Spirodela intermedia]CAA7411025.1 unnamed protein product [Spirodela intermedia]
MERALIFGDDDYDDLESAFDLPAEMHMTFEFPDDGEPVPRQPALDYVKNPSALLRTPADIYDHNDSYSFVIDMPGLEANMIKVTVEDDKILHVVGRRRKKAAEEEPAKAEGEVEARSKPEAPAARPIRIERRRARYMRRFSLPKDADREKVKASYRNGVLTVMVDKVPAKGQPSRSRSVSIPVS